MGSHLTLHCPGACSFENPKLGIQFESFFQSPRFGLHWGGCINEFTCNTSLTRSFRSAAHFMVSLLVKTSAHYIATYPHTLHP